MEVAVFICIAQNVLQRHGTKHGLCVRVISQVAWKLAYFYGMARVKDLLINEIVLELPKHLKSSEPLKLLIKRNWCVAVALWQLRLNIASPEIVHPSPLQIWALPY